MNAPAIAQPVNRRSAYIFTLLTMVIIAGMGLPFLRATSDAPNYIAMAAGNTASVHNPYVKRFLHPFLAHLISTTTGASLAASFLAVDLAALVIFAAALAFLIASEGQLRPADAILLLCPASIQLLSDFYMQDLLYAAILAVFFLALRRSVYAAVVMLPLLFITREITLLLSIVLLWIAWKRRDRALAIASGVGGAAGLIASAAVARLGMQNIHGLPDIVYTAAKIPNNLLWNVFGVRLWTNTQIRTNHCIPVWQHAVPGWMHAGQITAFGVCGISWSEPVRVVWILLASFGVAPVLLWRVRKSPSAAAAQRSVIVECAVLFSLVAIAAGILGGNDVQRYITYAWPLFWLVAAVYSAGAVRNLSRRQFALFAGANVALTALWMVWGADATLAIGVAPVVFAALCWLALYRWFRYEDAFAAKTSAG